MNVEDSRLKPGPACIPRAPDQQRSGELALGCRSQICHGSWELHEPCSGTLLGEALTGTVGRASQDAGATELCRKDEG